MTKFNGFGPEAIGFFKALTFHQDREWFKDHQALYETQVKGPTLELVEELTERFAKAGIPLKGGKNTLFRIYRDVRFAKDKRPYQTHAGAVLTSSGDKQGPGILYIHIAPPDVSEWDGSPTGSFVAVGFHQPEPAQLQAFRTAIKRDPKAFQAMEAALKKNKLALGTESAMTRLPRGFEDMKGSPVEEALRLRSLIVEEPIEEALVTTPKLADRLVKFAERGRPVLDFGWKALGMAP